MAFSHFKSDQLTKNWQNSSFRSWRERQKETRQNQTTAIYMAIEQLLCLND